LRPEPEAGGLPAWLPWAAALAACAAFALVLFDVGLWHPGYAYGDERIEICWLQNMREGTPMAWEFGRGCLTRFAQWLWVRVNGADLASLHTPELAVMAMEFVFLALVARRWFGEEAAAWSVLALALSAQTWVWERSLLSFQALPMESLLLALLAGRVRGRLGALLWGLGASLVFLDYDGALIAVPALWLACAALDPGFRRSAFFSGLGLFCGGLALFMLTCAAPADYLAVRLGQGLARASDPGLAGRAVFLGQLVKGGPALPYFGVSGWPGWPPWACLGLGMGAWSLRRSKGFVLVLWALGAVLVTQMVHSGYGLPLHRLSAAVPALALLSGLGFTVLRRRLGSRAWLLALLLAAGAASEGFAWWRHQMTFAPELYDRCQGLEAVRGAYGRDLGDPLVRVVTQLSGSSQADARFVLDRPLALDQTQSPSWSPPVRVLAVVPGDYAVALKGPDLRPAWFWAAKGFEPAVVVRLHGAQAIRMAFIEDELAPLLGDIQDPPRERRDRIDAWLGAPIARDAWTRTAALEADLENALQAGALSEGEWAQFKAAPLVSAAPWMVLARADYASEPRLALEACQRAEALDPSDGEALLIEAACLNSLGDPRAAQVSRAWVSLRASGRGWRHTL
jgi:hypothetical protein